MVDLMLDVESLGNIPGCVLCQYTLVPFNINGKIYDGGISSYDILLHIGQQIAEGYDVDTDTLAWWMTNPIEVRRRVFSGDVSIGAFCIDLTHHLSDIVKEHKEYRIWSTSAKVDFGISPVLFKRSNISYPVNHRSERCARTYLEMTKLKYPKMKLPKGVTTHDAVDDCWRQIADLQCAYATNMEKKIDEDAIQGALEDNIRTTF